PRRETGTRSLDSPMRNLRTTRSGEHGPPSRFAPAPKGRGPAWDGPALGPFKQSLPPTERRNRAGNPSLMQQDACQPRSEGLSGAGPSPSRTAPLGGRSEATGG